MIWRRPFGSQRNQTGQDLPRARKYKRYGRISMVAAARSNFWLWLGSEVRAMSALGPLNPQVRTSAVIEGNWPPLKVVEEQAPATRSSARRPPYCSGWRAPAERPRVLARAESRINVSHDATGFTRGKVKAPGRRPCRLGSCPYLTKICSCVHDGGAPLCYVDSSATHKGAD